MRLRPRVHLILDGLIFIIFVIVLFSGLILWLALPSGGYQGGRNPAYAATVLMLDHDGWKDIHNWAGLAMGAVVGIHLLVHLEWIAGHTVRLLRWASVGFRTNARGLQAINRHRRPGV